MQARALGWRPPPLFIMLHLDFESRSTVDLLKAGLYVYAKHPLTDVLCAAWAIGDGPAALWRRGDKPHKRMLDYLSQGGMIAAWNAAFERQIWNNVFVRSGFPPLPIERFYCVAALARARGYPGSLDKAARFAGLPHQKDMAGHRLMLKLCKPRDYEADGTPIWWDDPEDHAQLGEYCRQDTEVERAMLKMLLPFTDEELADYHMSEHINDTGVHVDIELARKAVRESETETLDANATLAALTEGAVTSHTQVQKILKWAEDQGVYLPDLTKGTVEEALSDSSTPPDVCEVLELRHGNAKAAISKFSAIEARGAEGVVQGLYVFRGAGQTGRYSSMGLQIHNLLAETAAEAIPVFMRHGIKGLRMLGDPVHLLAAMIRPTFIPAPGKVFLIGDFSQIEARIAAWLAGARKVEHAFAQGRDVYCEFATRAYSREIKKGRDDKERKVGKACVLGLGFGGAIGALARSLKKDKITLPEKQLLGLVNTYRKDFAPEIPVFWYALNDAVVSAVSKPGTMVQIGPVSYLFDGVHLWCRLPSGRFMCYPYAIWEDGEYGGVVEYRRGNRAPKAGVTKWPMVALWYGMEIENLAQAIALDLLTLALRRIHKDSNFTIRMHTHDEIVAEVDEDQAEELLQYFKARMEKAPEWADGLPLKVEVQIASRYVK